MDFLTNHWNCEMTSIILHHVQSCWDDGFERLNTSFEEVAYNIITHLRRNRYKQVILTLFEKYKLCEEHYEYGFEHYVTDVFEYGYGWNEEDKTNTPSECEWCEGGAHSELVLIPDWLKQLKSKKVKLAGAFDGECIEDMEIALTNVGAKWSRINSLIV
jgi:hypothetical protein